MKRHASALAFLLLAVGPALAGPCTEDIAAAQTGYSQRLDAAANNGPTGTETTAAKLHHQPTPSSVTQAESKLGDLPPDSASKFNTAMQRARTADAAGDATACRTALSDASAALTP